MKTPWNKRRRGFMALLLGGLPILLQLLPLTRPPATYPPGSERYYLAFLDRGSFAKRAAAARTLLELKEKREYPLTLAIYWRYLLRRPLSDDATKSMLLLRLYSLCPPRHRTEARRLLYCGDSMEGWVKTSEDFEGKPVDFYFDISREAATHLIRNGDLCLKAARVAMLERGSSYYLSDRLAAWTVLNLFPDAPPYDPIPQPKNINELSSVTEQQLRTLDAWLEHNWQNFRWSFEGRRYVWKAR